MDSNMFMCPNCCAKELKRIDANKYQCAYCGSQWAEEDIVDRNARDREFELKRLRLEKKEERNRYLMAKFTGYLKSDNGGILVFVLFCLLVIIPMMIKLFLMM